MVGTRSTYVSHESSDNGLSREAAEVYSSAFRTSPGWLLNGDEPSGLSPELASKVSSFLDLYQLPESQAREQLANVPKIRPLRPDQLREANNARRLSHSTPFERLDGR